MDGLRRGALALAGTVALLGLSVLGSGTVRADESPSASESSSAETPLQRINALVQPSIVYLQQDWEAYVYDKANKQYLNGGSTFSLSFQCTGFVVNSDGYIATSGHCVDQDQVLPIFQETAAQWAVDNAYYVNTTLTVDDILGFQDYRVETQNKMNRADLSITVGWGAAASGIETAEVRAARVVGTQKTNAGDVALLKVEASDLNALSLSDQEVEVGTEIVSIGYPVSVDTVTDPDLTPSFKDGSISSVKTVQGGLLTVYEISAAVSGGMSGGPTVNLDGDVVGVNSFGISGETQPFNFVRPSSQLKELLADEGVDNVISETTQAYRDGLTAYWAGDKATAVEKLTTVVNEQPSNQLAAEYLNKARRLPEPRPEPTNSDEGGGFPILLVAIGGGVLAALAVVSGFLLIRRKKNRGRTGRTPGVTVTGVLVGPPPAPPVLTSSSTKATAIPLGPPTPPTPAEGPTPATSVAAGAPGAPVAPAAPAAPAGPAEPHFCGHCGAATYPGEEFCENCGTTLHH